MPLDSVDLNVTLVGILNKRFYNEISYIKLRFIY